VQPVTGDLQTAVTLIREFGATIVALAPDDLGGHALAYATAGWEVFPLAGKVPLVPSRNGGRGVLDATTDFDQVAAWWERWPTANIGGRVPAGVVVVDIDPRSGGLETWVDLVAEHGELVTRTARSGRGDNGRHLYVGHPGGRIRGTIGHGVDVKTHAGYTVLPPSIHPGTGQPYRWNDASAAIAPAPGWLTTLLRRPPATPKLPTARPSSYDGDSIADWYTTTRTSLSVVFVAPWPNMIEPGRHGRLVVRGGGGWRRWRPARRSSSRSGRYRHRGGLRPLAACTTR